MMRDSVQLSYLDFLDDVGPLGGRRNQWEFDRDLTKPERANYPEPAGGRLVYAHPPHPTEPKSDTSNSVLALQWTSPTGHEYHGLTDGYLIQTHADRAGWLPYDWNLNFFPLAWSAVHLDRWYDVCERLIVFPDHLGTDAVRFESKNVPKALELIKHTRMILRHLSLAQFGRWNPPTLPWLSTERLTAEQAVKYEEREDGYTDGRQVFIGGKAYPLTPQLAPPAFVHHSEQWLYRGRGYWQIKHEKKENVYLVFGSNPHTPGG